MLDSEWPVQHGRLWDTGFIIQVTDRSFPSWTRRDGKNGTSQFHRRRIHQTRRSPTGHIFPVIDQLHTYTFPTAHAIMGNLQSKLCGSDERSEVVDLWLWKIPYSKRHHCLYYFERQLVEFCGSRADFDMLIFYPPAHLWMRDGTKLVPTSMRLRIVLRGCSMGEREIFKLKDDNHQYCLEKRELRENDELLDFPAPPQDHRVEEGFFWSSKLYPARS